MSLDSHLSLIFAIYVKIYCPDYANYFARHQSLLFCTHLFYIISKSKPPRKWMTSNTQTRRIRFHPFLDFYPFTFYSTLDLASSPGSHSRKIYPENFVIPVTLSHTARDCVSQLVFCFTSSATSFYSTCPSVHMFFNVFPKFSTFLFSFTFRVLDKNYPMSFTSSLMFTAVFPWFSIGSFPALSIQDIWFFWVFKINSSFILAFSYRCSFVILRL